MCSWARAPLRCLLTLYNPQRERDLPKRLALLLGGVVGAVGASKGWR